MSVAGVSGISESRTIKNDHISSTGLNWFRAAAAAGFTSVLFLIISLFMLTSADDLGAEYITITVTLLLTMLISCASLIFFTFVSYKWRQLLIAEGNVALVPEEWGRIIEDLIKQTKKVHSDFYEYLNETNETRNILRGFQTIFKEEIQKSNRKSREQFDQLLNDVQKTNRNTNSEILDEIIKFQEVIRNRDEKIHKLEEGYDQVILHSYFRRLIRLHEEADRLVEKDILGSKDASFIRKLAEIALEDCYISVENIELGIDSRDETVTKLIDVDSIKYDQTSNETQAHKISFVESPAYIYGNEEGVNKVIKPAIVRVFQYRPESKVRTGAGFHPYCESQRSNREDR